MCEDGTAASDVTQRAVSRKHTETLALPGAMESHTLTASSMESTTTTNPFLTASRACQRTHE